MSTAETGHPAWCPTDPTETDTCPGCGATHGAQRITGTSPTVAAWSCSACGMNWAATVVETVCFPVTELVNIDPMASVATTVWRCRLCEHEATTASRPAARSDAVAHLVGEHRATIGVAP